MGCLFCKKIYNNDNDINYENENITNSDKNDNDNNQNTKNNKNNDFTNKEDEESTGLLDFEENKNDNRFKNEKNGKCEEEKKLLRLINPRFNCYLNSSLQSFFHLDRFNSFIKQYEFNNNCRLTNEYLNLLNQIELGKKELDPRGIKKILSEEEEKYKYNNQEDANEFNSSIVNDRDVILFYEKK